MSHFVLYFLAGIISLVCTAVSLPLWKRWVGAVLLDKPGGLKHHAHTVPAVGGCGLFTGLTAALIAVRLFTQFPSGTLHSLRGIILGGALVFCMGLLDDIKKPKGLNITTKLFFQAAAACCLIYYGISIHIFQTPWITYPLTFLWVVGLTNAFNLLDIMDGLCTTQAMVCTLGLLLIAFPSKFVYVNFAAMSLLGACIAFLPFNFSSKNKLFLGDSGSNLLGFLIAALCLGTGYSESSVWGFLAPLFIVLVPATDISFVTLARITKGKNPLQGSADHAALRLQAAGWSGRVVLRTFAAAAVAGNLLAWLLTFCPPMITFLILLLTSIIVFATVVYLMRLEKPHAR